MFLIVLVWKPYLNGQLGFQADTRLSFNDYYLPMTIVKYQITKKGNIIFVIRDFDLVLLDVRIVN